MKREKIVTFLTGFVLACLLSFGAMGAMISGLNLLVESPNSLYAAWAVAAVVGCILFSFQKGWLPALLIAVLGLGYLWEYQYLSLPIRALITRLSFIYDSAYGWGVLEFAGVDWKVTPLDLPLMAWGCLIALTAAGTVAGGRGLILTVCLTLLPAASTVVVTNTAPEAPYVFAVMLGLILLLLTSTVRRNSTQQGAKLTLMAALPVGLLLGLLFAVYPQDTYVNRSEEYLDEIVGWWQSNIAVSWDSSGLLGQSSGIAVQNTTTNLSLVGPRADWRYPVMDLTSSNVGGTLYLRGQDYDLYDGTSWTASPDRKDFVYATQDNGNTITISTRRTLNVLYLPYYTASIYPTKGGRADNDSDLTAYSFEQAEIPLYLDALMHSHSDDSVTTRSDTVSDAYLSLPEHTRAWAEDYLTAHMPLVWEGYWTAAGARDEYGVSTLSNTEIAEMIADHVLVSARYDKDTPRMDRDHEDFAQWFLEESDTGYCVHFATAAAVLLRTAGVPARYVTGYMARVEAGVTTTVRADQAHAWVEYYEPLVNNWVVLEATPPDLGEETTETTEATEATEETAGTEATEPPTEGPTVPSSEGEDPTRPSDTGTRPGDQEDPAPDLTPLWTALKWLLVPLGLWVLIVMQYRLRRSRRHRGSPNARALAKWQDAELLCRLTKQTPPEELEILAQKAKFSQHTLTAEELRAFDAWLEAQRAKPLARHLRFVCRYVLALW